MMLTWKDAVTTLVTSGLIAFYYAVSHGTKLPVNFGARGAIVVIFILGIFLCAFGSQVGGEMSSFWKGAFTMLGIAALAFGVIGLITGTKLFLLLLTGTVVLLWAFATARHLIG